MRDPEMVFEVNPDSWQTGAWAPVSYRQDNLGVYQEAVFVDDGSVMLRPKLVRDLQAFARQWDRNIADQGFLNASQGGGQ